MTEVETIRTAVAHMRELADAADRATAMTNSGTWHRAIDGVVDGSLLAAEKRFAAAADPSFVRAVADWLEAEVHTAGTRGLDPHTGPAALAVARTFLKEDTDE